MLLEARGMTQGRAAVFRARKLMGHLQRPDDKVALARALWNMRGLSRRHAILLAAAAPRWGGRAPIIVDRLLAGHPLRPNELGYLRWWWRETDDRRLRLALAIALREGLFRSTQIDSLIILARSSKGMLSPGGLPNVCRCDAADVPGDACVTIPADPARPDRDCVDLSITPGEEDDLWEDQEGERQKEIDPTLEEGGDPAGESLHVRQSARRLRLRNGSNKKVVFHVEYKAPTEKDEVKWFPNREPTGDKRKALTYEVEPGDTVDVEDNGWRVSAQKARIWADGDGRSWNQFKDKDLDLVPEKDEGGNESSYLAATPQNISFTVR
jgi:hypothetical protein